MPLLAFNLTGLKGAVQCSTIMHMALTLAVCSRDAVMLLYTAGPRSHLPYTRQFAIAAVSMAASGESSSV